MLFFFLFLKPESLFEKQYKGAGTLSTLKQKLIVDSLFNKRIESFQIIGKFLESFDAFI